MKVYALMSHQYGEQRLEGIYASRRLAWADALRMKRAYCEQEMGIVRLLGRRERFDDGSLGEFWSDAYRRLMDFDVRESELRGVAA